MTRWTSLAGVSLVALSLALPTPRGPRPGRAAVPAPPRRRRQVVPGSRIGRRRQLRRAAVRSAGRIAAGRLAHVPARRPAAAAARRRPAPRQASLTRSGSVDQSSGGARARGSQAGDRPGATADGLRPGLPVPLTGRMATDIPGYGYGYYPWVRVRLLPVVRLRLRLRLRHHHGWYPLPVWRRVSSSARRTSTIRMSRTVRRRVLRWRWVLQSR